MFIEEKAHYSLLQRLRIAFSGELEVVDSFPRLDLKVPTLSVNLSSVDFTKLEIGNYNNIREITWLIDVFSKNKTQRDRATFKLFYILEQKIPILDYGLGFSNPNLPEIGAIIARRLRIDFVDVEIEDVEELHYRSAGLFTAEIQTY